MVWWVVIFILRFRGAGFSHSAFTFASESQVSRSSLATTDVPTGALISYLQRGLQYKQLETHINEARLSFRACAEERGIDSVLERKETGSANVTRMWQEGIEIQCDAAFTLTGHHVCNVKPTNHAKEKETDKEEPLYEMKDVNQEYSFSQLATC